MGMQEDFCAFAKQLEADLHQLVAPFGWKLTVSPDTPGRVVDVSFLYRFCLLVRDESSVWRGRAFDEQVRLSLQEWLHNSYPGSRWGNDLPMRWALQLMQRTLNYIANPPLPTAPQPDWRTTATVPEDFYAM